MRIERPRIRNREEVDGSVARTELPAQHKLVPVIKKKSHTLLGLAERVRDTGGLLGGFGMGRLGLQ